MFLRPFRINVLILLLVLGLVSSRTEAHDAGAFNDSIAVAQNLAVSVAGFFSLNMLLYRSEWYANQVGTTLAVLGISCVDVFLNLNNYVVTENSACGNNIYLLPSIVIVFLLEEFRYSMQKRTPSARPPPLKAKILTAIVHVLKNKVNFVVTENWFPRSWSKPPEPESTAN